MCLSKVTDIYTSPIDLIVDGWKEFSGAGKSLMFINMGGTVPIDKWVKADEVKASTGIAASDGRKYQAGFHVYADEAEIKSSLHYRRVYVRSITCAGDQSGKKCVVAQEMFVPSNPYDWPPLGQTQPLATSPVKKLISRVKGKS